MLAAILRASSFVNNLAATQRETEMDQIALYSVRKSALVFYFLGLVVRGVHDRLTEKALANFNRLPCFPEQFDIIVADKA